MSFVKIRLVGADRYAYRGDLFEARTTDDKSRYYMVKEARSTHLLAQVEEFSGQPYFEKVEDEPVRVTSKQREPEIVEPTPVPEEDLVTVVDTEDTDAEIQFALDEATSMVEEGSATEEITDEPEVVTETVTVEDTPENTGPAVDV